MFVLRREDDKFVAPPGEEHSYTPDLTKARIFRAREEAERDACGNERVVDVIDLLRDCVGVERRRSFQPPWKYLHVYRCSNCGREYRIDFHGHGTPPGGIKCDCNGNFGVDGGLRVRWKEATCRR